MEEAGPRVRRGHQAGPEVITRPLSHPPGFNASGTDEASAGQYARREDVEEFKRKLNDAVAANPKAAESAMESVYAEEVRSWASRTYISVLGTVAATLVKQRKPAVVCCGYCGSRLTGLTCNECGERRLA